MRYGRGPALAGFFSEVPDSLSIRRSCSTSARSTLARHPPAVGQSYAARQAAYDCPKAGGRRAKLERADVLHANVQRQVWRGGPREGSGRDASVLLMLQRDCMVSMPPIRASQPSPTRALVHSQQVALTRAQDAAAELELSCGPSTTQLEAAEDQARWDPAMQRGRRCRRRGRSRRPHHRPRCAACHWSAWSAASAASGLVLAASGYAWVAPESGPWAEPFQRV